MRFGNDLFPRQVNRRTNAEETGDSSGSNQGPVWKQAELSNDLDDIKTTVNISLKMAIIHFGIMKELLYNLPVCQLKGFPNSNSAAESIMVKVTPGSEVDFNEI